jgi:hypothetical protein
MLLVLAVLSCTLSKKDGGVAQAVEGLPSKREAQSSNPSFKKIKIGTQKML